VPTGSLRADFDRLRSLAAEGQWTDKTAVPPEVFDPLQSAEDVSDEVAAAENAARSEARKRPEPTPQVAVHFAGDFSEDDMALFLEYVAAKYRDQGGTGLIPVKGGGKTQARKGGRVKK
jgi:hypothetical protein